MFIDTHAHLNLEPFIENVVPFLDRAKKNKVCKIIVPSIDVISSEKSIELSEKYNEIYSAVGIHPNYSEKAEKNYLEKIEHYSKNKNVIAIGEIGLDYYRDYSGKESQKRIFQEQLEFAKSLELPIIIHNRDADSDVLEIMEKVDYFNGQMHCFSSDLKFAENIIEKGMLVSFTGVVTFSKKAREVVSNLPLDKLMIETDSPFMAPIPFRGKTCEPSFVIEIAKKYSEIFGVKLEVVEKVTTKNAEELFKI